MQAMSPNPSATALCPKPTRVGPPLAAITTLAIFLVLPATAKAGFITVGPGCAETTVQGAVDAAEASSGPDEIRLTRHSDFLEAVVVGEDSSDLIHISGGWDGCSASGRTGRSSLRAPSGSLGAINVIVYGSMILEDMDIHGNGEIGVVAGPVSDVSLVNTVIHDSSSGIRMSLGSAVSVDADSVILFNENTSDYRGAGISCGTDDSPGGYLYLAGKVHSNSATRGAGLFAQQDCTIELADGAEISHNDASRGGGGIYLRNGATLTTLPGPNGISLHNNTAERGGGLFMRVAESAATLTDVEVFANRAIHGGGLYVQSHNRIDLIGNTRIHDNVATETGGGVSANTGSVVALTGGVRIFSNEANLGGGVYLTSTAHLGGAGVPPVHMGITDNNANLGGGLYLNGVGTSANLNNFIIENNSAFTAGGGVAVRAGASFELDRSNGLPCAHPPRCATLRRNRLENGDLGSALFVDGGAEAELYQVYAELNSHDNSSVATRVFVADGFGTNLHLEGVQIWRNRAAYLISATNSAAVTAGFVSAARNYWPLDPNDPLDVFGATASTGGSVSLNSSILIDTRGYSGFVTNDCLLVDDETGLGPSQTRMSGADPLFMDANAGDLHLHPESPAVDYCDNSQFNPVDFDVDQHDRGIDLANTLNILGPYDLGIDESLVDAGLFADGFESGDTSAW